MQTRLQFIVWSGGFKHSKDTRLAFLGFILQVLRGLWASTAYILMSLHSDVSTFYCLHSIVDEAPALIKSLIFFSF